MLYPPLSFHLMSVFLIASLWTQSALAQGPVVQIPSDYSAVEVTLDPGFTGNSLTLYAPSAGNVTHGVAVRLEAPAGTTLSAWGIQAKRAHQSYFPSTRGWYRLKLDTTLNPRRGKNSLTVRGTGAFSATSSAFSQSIARNALRSSSFNVCDAVDYNELRTVLQAIYPGTNWTNQAICSWLRENYGGGGGSEDGAGNLPPATGDNGGVTPPGGNTSPTTPSRPNLGILVANTLLHKDNCAKRVNSYLVRFDIDLSGIDPAVRAAGATMRFQLYNARYRGRMASSMKPDSDGKFRGSPLILMSTLGYNEAIDVVGWKRGRPARRMAVPVNGADRAYWRGIVLARAPVRRVVNARRRLGNRANFELYTGSNAYAVCFALTGRRQRANGYP